MSLLTSDYDYHLPEELIASRPPADRAGSRMMVIRRDTGEITHAGFSEIETYLRPDDLMILNDTRVIPARVFSEEGDIEILCLDRVTPTLWRCLAKPGKKMKPGRTRTFGGVEGTVTEVLGNGDRMIRWASPLDLDKHGHLALPHYMDREDDDMDRERYQTVFAKHEGAIAAPTAGLHFTPEMLERIPHDFLTLHVGVGTFRPVSAGNLSEHRMHSEKYFISEKTAARINRAERVIAVGTTVARVLETLAKERDPEGGPGRIPEGGPGRALSGATDIFLHPPHSFRSVDALLTNFHLPQSTLIMLVSAFAGRELVLEAYRRAVEKRYRFYSYGDCMLIL